MGGHRSPPYFNLECADEHVQCTLSRMYCSVIVSSVISTRCFSLKKIREIAVIAIYELQGEYSLYQFRSMTNSSPVFAWYSCFTCITGALDQITHDLLPSALR